METLEDGVTKADLREEISGNARLKQYLPLFDEFFR